MMRPSAAASARRSRTHLKGPVAASEEDVSRLPPEHEVLKDLPSSPSWVQEAGTDAPLASNRKSAVSGRPACEIERNDARHLACSGP
jgi:hypothetical protein